MYMSKQSRILENTSGRLTIWVTTELWAVRCCCCRRHHYIYTYIKYLLYGWQKQEPMFTDVNSITSVRSTGISFLEAYSVSSTPKYYSYFCFVWPTWPDRGPSSHSHPFITRIIWRTKQYCTYCCTRTQKRDRKAARLSVDCGAEKKKTCGPDIRKHAKRNVLVSGVSAAHCQSYTRLIYWYIMLVHTHRHIIYQYNTCVCIRYDTIFQSQYLYAQYTINTSKTEYGTHQHISRYVTWYALYVRINSTYVRSLVNVVFRVPFPLDEWMNFVLFIPINEFYRFIFIFFYVLFFLLCLNLWPQNTLRYLSIKNQDGHWV